MRAPLGMVATVMLFATVVLAVTPSSVWAQVFNTEAVGQEVLSADFFGVDARALGMGNTGIALGRDGSALIYNPGNLARIKRIELRAGLSHLRSSNETTFETLLDDRDITKTRINALSLAVPVPTYRGSLVFAFGIHRINSFDRTFAVTFVDNGAGLTLRDRVIETGGIWKWSAGGSIDISPKLSTGLSLHVLTGNDEYRATSEDARSGDVITGEQLIELDYVGVSATAGLTYSVSQSVTAGLVVETPTLMEVEEIGTFELDTMSSNFTWVEDPTFSSYTLTRPFVFGLGLAGTFNRFNLAGDFRYTDWTQLDFDYASPELDPDENRTLRFIQDELTDVLSIQLGGEVLLPEEGLTLRAGYFRDPLPVDEQYIEKQRQFFTGGIGFLIDRVMTLDVAYVHGGYELRDADPGTYNAEYKTRRVFATFGYRI